MQLVMLLGAAFVLGALAQRLRQSPIIGYLLAGTIVGPLLFNPDAINQTAELGVSLLLFSIGLEFSFSRLRSMGRMAFGAGTVQVIGTLLLVALILAAWLGHLRALAIGAIVTLSSTAVVMRVLVDRAEIDSVRGRSCLSILLLQDIAIVPLVIMVSLLAPTGGDISIALHVLKIIAAAIGLALVLYLLLYWGAPALLSAEGIFANRELSVLLAITVGIGASWAAHSLGISPALGAFVAGMLLAESQFATQIQADIGSLRIIMVTLFFASVGMLAKPLFFMTHIHWILLAAILIFLFKALIIYGTTRLFGLDHLHAAATAISLGQIGEFSFVLAASANQGALFSSSTFDLIISTVIILMFAAPYMVTYAFPIAERLRRASSGADPARVPSEQPLRNRALVIGFGPAGRQVVEHLKDHQVEPIIIDVNPRNQAEAKRMGLKHHLGDASNEEVLAHAGLPEVCLAVITIPDTQTSIRVVSTLRRLRPLLPIAVRCRYNRHFKALERAGAQIVVDEETQIGHMLAHEIAAFMQDGSETALACRLAGVPETEPEARPEDPSRKPL